MVGATIGIGALSMSVWAHHMFGTGQVLLPFFAFLSFLIAVPTGIKFFNWIGTMWRGQLTFETPMLFAIGFLVTFLLGGLSGVLLASPPLDFHVTDTYFVVAHFHYVLFGTIVFAVFAGIYFWFPKMTGRMMDERLGRVHFWLTMVGFHTTFLVQHWLGNEGMPRRYADYLPTDGFTTLNMISTIGSFILGASTLLFLYNVWKSYTTGPLVEVDDPWGYGNRWSGPPRARRRCATSTGCRASAPSGRRSTPSSRTWRWHGERPRRRRWRPPPAGARSGRWRRGPDRGPRTRTVRRRRPTGRRRRPTGGDDRCADQGHAGLAQLAPGPLGGLRRHAGGEVRAGRWCRTLPDRVQRGGPDTVVGGDARPRRPPSTSCIRSQAARPIPPGGPRSRSTPAAYSPLVKTASIRSVSRPGWKSAPGVPATQCAGQVSTKSGSSAKCVARVDVVVLGGDHVVATVGVSLERPAGWPRPRRPRRRPRASRPRRSRSARRR